MDIYPTIIESLGAQIDGHRLGLGTSLYSEQPTLIEVLGLEELNKQMSAKSDFYEKVILNGDEGKIPTKTDEKEDPEEEIDSEAVQAPTAQQYQANKESFSDTDYVWEPTYVPQPSEGTVNSGTSSGGNIINPEPTEPGITVDPGTSGGTTTDPGTSGGGTTTDPGNTDPGTSGGTTTDPGTSGGSTDPGTSGGTTTDPGTSGGTTTDPGTTPTQPSEPTDPGTTE